MQPEAPKGIKTFLRGMGLLAPEPPKPLSAKDWLAQELKYPQDFGLSTPDGESHAVRISGKDADGFVGLDRTTGGRFVSFASASGLRDYLERSVRLPERVAPPSPVAFQAYTRLQVPNNTKEVREDTYQGRPRITSVSNVRGGVYLPESLKKMEAIVVDWEKEKDPFLHAYLSSLAQSLNRYAEKGGAPTTLVILRAINEDILKKFPYCHAMAKDGHLDDQEWFIPNKKVTLGVIMENQWCVCRHHALLFTAAIEFLQSTKLHPEIADSLKGVKARYLADMMDLNPLGSLTEEDDKISGHAYCGVSWKDHVVIVDPSGGLVATVPEIALLSMQKTRRLRYLYSAMRFMMDTSPERLYDKEITLTMAWARKDGLLKTAILQAIREARQRDVARSVRERL